jgi:uncharacterized repeat protein (TIGR01451 family)
MHFAATRIAGGQAARKVLLPAALAIGVLVVAVAPGWAAITNSAVATGSYGAATVTSPPSTASVPVTPGTASLSVVKTASPPANVTAGQTITYSYVITNTGTLTLTNVTPGDAHNASGPVPVPGSETLTGDAGPVLGDSSDAAPGNGVWSVLAPGDTVTFTGSYTVRQADVDHLQ